MDYFHLLLDCGLSKKEASTYLALLERGELTLSKISLHTHINRPALYQVLPHLQEKGLITERKQGKRTVYKAESPERIEAIISQGYQRSLEGIKQLQVEQEKRVSEKPIVQFFDTKNATDFVFDDVALTLPRGGTYYRYSSQLAGNKREMSKASIYYEKRESKQLERVVITSEEKLAQKQPKLNRHLKAIPKEFDLFEDNVSLLIYGDKTAYIDYNSMTAVLIESPKIARFQEKLFKALYRYLPGIEK